MMIIVMVAAVVTMTATIVVVEFVSINTSINAVVMIQIVHFGRNSIAGFVIFILIVSKTHFMAVVIIIVIFVIQV